MALLKWPAERYLSRSTNLWFYTVIASPCRLSFYVHTSTVFGSHRTLFCNMTLSLMRSAFGVVSASFQCQLEGLPDFNCARPINAVTGECITPTDLNKHCFMHKLLAPCCLCPLKYCGQCTFTEVAIMIEMYGRHHGEYIARCACNSCGYHGKLLQFKYQTSLPTLDEVNLERIYPKPGVPVGRYPRRDYFQPSMLP
jgi:hypothetical protein